MPGQTSHPWISYGMPDITGRERARYEGKRVAVLGGRSAIGTLIALSNLQDSLPRFHDGSGTGGGTADQFAAGGALGTDMARLGESGSIRLGSGFLAAIEGSHPLRALITDGRVIEVNELIIATGFGPDLSFLRELWVALDPALECPPALAPVIDPNLQTCGTVRPYGAAEPAHLDPGFYIAGMKSYGRAPTFLLAPGHEQVRSIVAAIEGDHEAAARVELVLPELASAVAPVLGLQRQ